MRRGPNHGEGQVVAARAPRGGRLDPPGEAVEGVRHLPQGRHLDVRMLVRGDRRLVPEDALPHADRVEPEGLRGLDIEVDAVADHHRLLGLAARVPEGPLEDRGVRLRDARLLRDLDDAEEGGEPVPPQHVPHRVVLVRDHAEAPLAPHPRTPPAAAGRPRWPETSAPRIRGWASRQISSTTAKSRVNVEAAARNSGRSCRTMTRSRTATNSSRETR